MCARYILSLDLETTGLSTARDDIIQIAIACEHWNNTEKTVLESFNRYVHTSTPISIYISELTHITAETLLRAPSLLIVAREIEDYIERVCTDKEATCILVAYNGIRFDIPILATCIERVIGPTEAVLWWRRLRIDYLFDPFFFLKVCPDDSRLLRRTNGKASLKLGDVHVALLGTTIVNAHNALSDCNAVLSILHDTIFKTALDKKDERYCRNLCLHVASCTIVKQKTKQRTLPDMFKKRKSTCL